MSATSAAAAASTQPLLVSTIVSIGTPASEVFLKSFMEVEVTRSMTCADLYTSSTASQFMFPKLEDLDPCCYIGLTENELHRVELSEPLYGFMRVSRMDVARDTLMVCYQRPPNQAMLAAGISAEQQQSMSNDEAARWHQERARTLKRKRSRAANTSSSTSTLLSLYGSSTSHSDTSSDLCITQEWVQEAGQVGRQPNPDASDNNNNNNNNNNNRINIDTLLEVSRKKKIPIFADPLLPGRTRNLRQYKHGYENCMVASTRFVVFVVHKKPATKRVLVAPLANDSPDALPQLRRSAEQVYMSVRRLELGDQRVRNVCLRVLDILQSGSALTIDIMDIIKAAGIVPPPPTEPRFASAVTKLVENSSRFGDLEFIRMLANVLNIAASVNKELGTERGADGSAMEENLSNVVSDDAANEKSASCLDVVTGS
ncbi:hypothetical protein GQ42DRAFT_162837, partial [Ramicandelaber brevisporus]